MAHIVSCKCGRRLPIPTRLLGRKVKCSACGSVLDTSCRGTNQERRKSHAEPRSKSSRTRSERVVSRCPKCGEGLQVAKQAASQQRTCPSCREDGMVSANTLQPKAGLDLGNEISDLLDEVGLNTSHDKVATRTCGKCNAELMLHESGCRVCGYLAATRAENQRRKKWLRFAQAAVGWGVSLIYFGLLLTLGTCLLTFVASLARNASLLAFCVVLQALATFLGISGKLMCIVTPAKYGQNYALLAAIVEALAFAFWFYPISISIHGSEVPAVYLANLVSMVSYLLFLKFLIKCCEGMKQSGLVGSAQLVMDRTLKLIFVPVVSNLFVVLLVFLFGPAAGAFRPFLLLGTAALGIYMVILSVQWLVEYLKLLSYLRRHLLA